MTLQPSFERIYLDYLSQFKGGSLKYRVRLDSSFLHDLQFVTSILHGGVVDVSRDLSLKGGTLRCEFDRERREIAPVRERGRVLFSRVRSLLQIGPIDDVVWRTHGTSIERHPSQTLRLLAVSQGFWDPDASPWQISLICEDATLDAAVASKAVRISVRDLRRSSALRTAGRARVGVSQR